MMFFSIKFRLVLLLSGALGLLALGGGLFTKYGVETALTETMEESARNAVLLSASIIQDKHRDLLYLTVEQATRMRNFLALYERIIRGLAEKTETAPEDLVHIALPEDFSLWKAVPGGEAEPVVTDMPPGYNPYREFDIRGRRVGERILARMRQGASTDTLIRADSRLGDGHDYFGRNFVISRWGLMLGLWVDLDTASELRKKHFADALDFIRDALGEIRLGSGGFMLVAEPSGKVVVSSETWLPGDFLTAVNPVTGNRLIDDIVSSSQNPDAFVRARVPTPDGVREALAFSAFSRPFGWHVACVSFMDEIRRPGRRLSLFLVLGLLTAAAVLGLLSALLLRRLTAPLAALTDFARKLPDEDFFREREGGKDAALADLARRPRRDEIGELAKSFLFMDASLRSRVRELIEMTGSRERMEGELQAATEIQAGILPRRLRDDEVRGRFALEAFMAPAREVGGDLYDYFMPGSDRLCLAIGDVSDKGVPAALFMSMAMVLLRSAAASAADPGSVVRMVNAGLERENANCMFVTLFVAFLDVRTGVMTYVNAGHNPPLLRRGSVVRELDAAGGPVVGVFADAVFENAVVRLEPGDCLLLYTDGVTEAMNGRKELFGEAALGRAFGGGRADDPVDVIRRVRDAVKTHAGDAAASDDLTLLCLVLPEKA